MQSSADGILRTCTARWYNGKTGVVQPGLFFGKSNCVKLCDFYTLIYFFDILFVM
jgi:hypothetical protein